MTIKDAQIELNRIATQKGFWRHYDEIPEIMNNVHEYVDEMPNIKPSTGITFNPEEMEWVKQQHLITKLALIITEVSEAIEAIRKNKRANLEAYSDEVEVGDNKTLSVKDKNEVFESYIKDTLEDELADTAIRLFDFCEKLEIDLTWHIQQKSAYNATREHLHGKTC